MSTETSVNISIDVAEINQGVQFYCEVFGWLEKSRPFPKMAVLDGNNVSVCIHEKAKGTVANPAGSLRDYSRHWTPVHLDFHVKDVSETLSIALSLGATVEQQYDEPKKAAFCADPFGNGFCIISQN